MLNSLSMIRKEESNSIPSSETLVKVRVWVKEAFQIV